MERTKLEAYEHLVTTAVNACQEINPDNPLAVAEGICDAYEACRLLFATVEDFMPNIGRCVLQNYAQLNDGLVLGKKVLAKRRVT